MEGLNGLDEDVKRKMKCWMVVLLAVFCFVETIHSLVYVQSIEAFSHIQLSSCECPADVIPITTFLQQSLDNIFSAASTSLLLQSNAVSAHFLAKNH